MAGIKHDAGKERLDLIPPEALMEVGRVLEFGSRKYADNSWHGIKHSRLIAASLRHIMKYQMGNDLDEESNLNHLAHAVTNLMFIIASPESDGRYKKDE